MMVWETCKNCYWKFTVRTGPCIVTPKPTGEEKCVSFRPRKLRGKEKRKTGGKKQ